MGPSVCTLGWWFSPWEFWGVWLVDIIVLPSSIHLPKNFMNSLFSIAEKWCWFNWWLACRRMQINPFLSFCTKLKYKWIKDLHIKADTLNLIEEKVGKVPRTQGHSGKFPEQNTNSLCSKSNNLQIVPHQIEKLL